jgi:hypothetical protein
MKKTLLFGLLISISFGLVFSQEEQVPNGGFETWKTHDLGFEYPVGWDNPNADLALFGLTPVTPSTDAAEGNFSAFLESQFLSAVGINFVIPGVVTLGTFVVDYINNSATLEGGISFSDRPLALKGSYKNYPAAGDSTMIVAIFTKWMPAKGKRDTIGFGGLFSKETVNTWTSFSIPINFFSEDAPDTMNVNVVSSNMITPNKDSYMYIDALSFEYPAGINDHETVVETNVFPNPASDKVTFTFEKEVQAELHIYSNDGQLVLSTTVDGITSELDLSKLASGTYYFAAYEKSKKISSGKIIINK